MYILTVSRFYASKNDLNISTCVPIIVLYYLH